ncbi:MAG: RHS repeat-associated core domain-containing protein [Planctomycetia bacterium]|nr:RHS repeat-associated core domain-containing protein [Planctomycetia bacterium]
MTLSHPDRQAAGRPASITGTDDDDFDAAYNGGAGAWDARVDLDLSGTLTSADDTLFTAEFVAGEAGGYRVLSRPSLANRLGYAGYQHAPELAKTRWHVRHRVLDSETGRWTRRDPAGYVDGPNMYLYANDNSVRNLDPLGLIWWICGADTNNSFNIIHVCNWSTPLDPANLGSDSDAMMSPHLPVLAKLLLGPCEYGTARCNKACNECGGCTGKTVRPDGGGTGSYCCVCPGVSSGVSDLTAKLWATYCTSRHEACHMNQNSTFPPYDNNDCRECQAESVEAACLREAFLNCLAKGDYTCANQLADRQSIVFQNKLNDCALCNRDSKKVPESTDPKDCGN